MDTQQSDSESGGKQPDYSGAEGISENHESKAGEKAGADIATVPYKVIEQMIRHPLTDAGIAKFQADYRAVFGE